MAEAFSQEWEVENSGTGLKTDVFTGFNNHIAAEEKLMFRVNQHFQDKNLNQKRTNKKEKKYFSRRAKVWPVSQERRNDSYG